MESQKYIVTVDQWGTEWCNEAGKLHRLDGPAVECVSGTKQWLVDGKRHRLDGPAIEYADGTKEWWVNGELHREDGPAIEYASGTKCWYVNDKRHRIDGPSLEWWDGDKTWYIEGKKYTETQFNEKVKQLKNKSCEGKIVEIEGVKYKLTSV